MKTERDREPFDSTDYDNRRTVVNPTALVAEADSLLERVEEAQTEQLALLEASPLELQYSTAFAAQLELKHEQVERVEDKLEGMLEQQASRLQQAQSSQPSIFSFPSTKAKWQQQLQLHQSAMQRLQGRLENVREIKDGIGLHGPRIEELATRKVRAQEPELAESWDEMRETQRRHQAVLRKQDQESKQKNASDIARESLGRALGLSQTR